MKLANPSRNAIGDRAGPEWLQLAADAYLDHRRRDWILREELGDVQFVPEAGVVLVHRVRAAHVARSLAGFAMRAVVSPTPPPMPRLARLPALPCAGPVSTTQLLALEPKTTRRSRDILGWLGIVVGAAVFVVALAVPLGDTALLVALMLAVRGGRAIMEALDLPRGWPW